MKVHWYFRRRVLENPDRWHIMVEMCEQIVAEPEHSEVQQNGRMRYWGYAPEFGYHIRVIMEPDGETLFNAHPDSGFTRRQRRE